MFDIVGDIHGCHDELLELLAKLNYSCDQYGKWTSNENRKLAFVGDIIDRGPKVWKCLTTVKDICTSGLGSCVIGNHDENLRQFLTDGSVVYAERSFPPTTIKQMDEIEASIDPNNYWHKHKQEIGKWLKTLPEFINLTDDLIICHGKANDKKPDWNKLDGKNVVVVHGHRTVKEVCIRSLPKGGQVINVDTGVPFGGKLSALRFPEMKVVSVNAKKQYWDTPLLEVVKYYDRKPY